MMGSLVVLYLAAVASGTSISLTGSCDVAVVGAGPGGAYVAWRVATAQPESDVCLFEQGSRAGGRVHSLRGQGPEGDLVVEAGAYRFAPNETCVKFLNFSYCVHTPLTGHLISDALKLPSVSYNPTPGAWDHGLRKIVDGDGHDAGYLTFVEAILAAPPANLAIHFGKELDYVTETPSDAPTNGPTSTRLQLHFKQGTSFAARKLVLNVPQRPLLRLLANSPSLAPADLPWPAPLTRPIAYPIVKLYVYYDDAWWINELGLRAGMFNNSDAWRDETMGMMADQDCLGSRQTPYPLQGSYHDGDIRCDETGKACRGFLQAAYMGDPQAVRLYEQFHLSGNDSAVTLDPLVRADHRFLLEGIHEALVKLHGPQLAAKNASARVGALRPRSGVVSVWTERASGIETGCHMPRDGPPTPPAEIPHRAIAPLVGSLFEHDVYVANEAFGTKECWAEGSLVMAENVVARLGVGRPSWLPQDVYDALLFPNATAVRAGPRPPPTPRHASDLTMATVGARLHH